MKTPRRNISLTLEDVRAHFEHWRASRKKRERIPEPLWREAASLVERYGITRVSRALRVHLPDLKRHHGELMNGEAGQGQVPAARSTMEWVEVVPSRVEPTSGFPEPGLLLDLERVDGTRLRIQGAQNHALARVVEHFLESC
ncbi:MAG: hypothetical protein GF341_04705 [candidate division Zixibacteria bacterium]|nr:hypothetical protein [candidate division Zixibacteria bacterium]